MPTEDLEEQGLAKNPDLELAQKRYLLKTNKHRFDDGLRESVLLKIKTDNMAPFYSEICEEMEWKVDEDLLEKMRSANESELLRLDEAVEDAEKHLGETEVRDAMLKKAEYYSQIGDKEAALTQFRKTSDKTVTLGFRLDIVFHCIRLGLFYMDHDVVKRNLDKAHTLIEEGGDWDRRNRLKVYRGVYSMATRDFAQAAKLFLETVATFTSYELMNYKQFVTYSVISSLIALERPEIRDKVVKGAEIQEVLYGLPLERGFLSAFYDCKYAQFFQMLAQVEHAMQHDRYLQAHCRYYVREMRIRAYKQLLESYKSLTLQYMAKSFGVTIEYMDQELARFIAAGRLNCKIDKVSGIVETTSPDSKNFQYQAVIKQGDALLNRVQKLSRVINI